MTSLFRFYRTVVRALENDLVLSLAWRRPAPHHRMVGRFVLLACATLALLFFSAGAAQAADSCFAHDGTTEFSSTDAQAVRDAVSAASAGGTVKIAGTCAGVSGAQVVNIAKALTLAGGYTTTNWLTSDPVANPTVLDALAGGRVINASQPVTVSNVTVQNGFATGFGEGGGAYFLSTATVTGTTFFSNTAYNGGAARFDTSAILTGAIFISNTASNQGGGVSFSSSSTALLADTTFTNNSAGGIGGGAIFYGGAELSGVTFVNNGATNGGGAYFGDVTVLTSTTFFSNTANGQGGGAWFIKAATLSDSSFVNNNASTTYGGGAIFYAAAALTDTIFAGNTAGSSGGGAYLTGSPAPSRIVNSLFARNRAGTGQGNALYLFRDSAGGTFDMIFTTIASPTLASGSAIMIRSDTPHTATITGTLISNYAIGIQQVTTGAVNENYNLFAGVTTPYAGVISSGGSSITGTAAFFDTTNYTLTAASAAIDAGVDAGVYTDFFGDVRPQQGGFDIGYDESPFAASSTDVCFTDYDGVAGTDFSSTDAQAVRSAVAAASAGGTVKIAGTCVGAVLDSGTTQVALINKTLTLAGGYTNTNWTTSYPITQPTTLDATQGGRVIFATAAATVQDLTMQNGKTTAASEHGGGIRTSQPITLSNVIVHNNVATGSNADGAGAYLASTARITGTTFISNTTALGYGGGLFSSGLLMLENSLITMNTGATPGGLQAFGTAYITNTTFVSNTATAGYGGGADFQGATTITGSRFAGNRASTTGGGANFSAAAQVRDSVFVNNSGTSGHGVVLGVTGQKRFVNVLFDRNTGTSSSAVIFISNGAVELVHTTITSPTLATVRAIGMSGGTLFVTNTIIANHATGLNRTGGVAGEDYSLFDGNTVNLSGVIASGGNSITGTAAFFDTTNYTLTAASAAINAGVDAGVYTDFFGDVRPQQGGFDIGYDESPFAAPVAPVCFTETTGDNTTDFASADAQAVRDAVAASSPGGTVKIAGTCAGVAVQGGITQTVYITQPLTLAGGYTTTNWLTSYPITQPTTLDAESGGRVIYASAALTVMDLTAQNGRWTIGGHNGGGAYFESTATLSGTHILSNTVANRGGGAYIAGAADITGGSFRNNQSVSFGGGFYANSSLTLSNAESLSNSVASGAGAGGVAFGSATVVGGLFQGNISNGGTGGLYANSGAIVTGTRFIDNRAFAGGAGGLYLPFGNSRIVNALFAGNHASQPGSAMQIGTTGSVEIIYSTIVSPTVGGTAALNVNNGTTYVTNTIISGYPIGIERGGGAVHEDYNLFDGNTVNLSGAVTSGGNSITGTAAFFDTTSYTLTAASAAINRGVDVGVYSDFFGEVRPQGGGFDIGYAETAYTTDVGIAKTVAPALVTPGGAITYTLAFSNNGTGLVSYILISDSVPLSVTVTGVTSSSVGSGVLITQTSGGPDFAWLVNKLDVGEGGFITLTGVVTASPAISLAGQIITNTAIITLSGDGTAGNNSSSAAPYRLCGPGTFLETTTNQCMPASPGYFVPDFGFAEAFQCEKGTYQPDSGMSSCIPAPVNTYVDTKGAVAPLPCPGDTYNPTEGATSVTACLPAVCFATPNDGATVFSNLDGRPVQQAVDVAAPGATVKVAGTCAGVWERASISQTAYISQPLTLAGGYVPTSTVSFWTQTPDPVANPTTIDANDGGRVIFATTALTVSNITLQRGNISGSGFVCPSAGCGGGVWAGSSLSLTNVQVLSNTARYDGGGVRATGTMTVGNSRFQNNSTFVNSGGGLSADSTLWVTNTDFISNTASNVGGGAYAGGEVMAANSRFEDNRAAGANAGGLYADSTLQLTNTHFISNTAQNVGGGVVALGTARVVNSRFENNRTNGDGGGLWAFSTLWLTNTQILSNTALRGGGAWVDNALIAVGSRFESNHSTGGLGGGLRTLSTLWMTDTHLVGNTASGAGGGAFAVGAATAVNSRFENNRSVGANGGGLYAQSTLQLTNTLFLRNRAGSNGGGLYLNGFGTVTERLVNVLLAGNRASAAGNAIYANHDSGDDTLTILHTTIATPTLTSSSAVVVANGMAWISNTIIVSHTTGIQQTGGTVTQDDNLFFGNTANTAGTVSGGGNSVVGDPAFVNPAADDYHLTAASAAINRGVDVGIFTDFDGDVRPQGGGFDIGYDETAYTTDVGIAKTVAPAIVTPGGPVTYTLSFSNTGTGLVGNIVISDSTPLSVTITGVTSSTFGSGPIIITQTSGSPDFAWNVSDLAVGAGGVITLTGTVAGDALAGTVITNTATITASSDIVTGNNSATVTTTVEVACVAPSTTYVDDDWVGTPPGADPDGGGPATQFGCDSFATVQGGVTGVTTGGNVVVAAGAYLEAQVLITKSVTVTGAGPALTVLDGQAIAPPLVGLVHIEPPLGDTGNVVFSGFTVMNPGTGGGTRAGMFVKPLDTATVVTISNNHLVGNNASDYGVYAYRNRGSMVFTGNVITNTAFNGMLIEQPIGATEISSNTITVAGASTSIFAMTYDSQNVTTTQRVANNTIDSPLASAIIFNPSPAFVGSASRLGKYTDVEIKGNVITNLGIGRTGIGLLNDTSDTSGAAGAIENPVITGNKITGAGAMTSTGILLRGLITNADISGNDIRSLDRGFFGAVVNTHSATGAEVHFNNFVNNPTGFVWNGVAAIDAENNWWGCNGGPGVAGCDPIAGIGAGSIDYDPWIVLDVAATPNPIVPFGTSTVTADMTQNSAPAPAGGTPPDLPVAFSATAGTIPSPGTITAGTASALYTSTAANSGDVCATVDNQTICLEVATVTSAGIAKQVAPGIVAPGGAITYTLAFSNAGPGVASAVIISDSAPAGVTLNGVISSTVGSGVVIVQTSGSPNFAWTVNQLAPGEGGLITLTGVATNTVGTVILNTATITASGDSTPENDSASALLTVARIDVFPAQPGVVPGDAVIISATVTPPLGELTVNFAIVSGSGGLSSPSAMTNVSGVAAVLYTSTAVTEVVQIDGELALSPAVRDRATVFVAAATVANGIEQSASGLYTVGNLSPNFIEIVKVGAGTPVMGWAEFAGNPCPASSPGSNVVSPYVDAMVEDVAGVDAIVVTLKYTGTVNASQFKPAWCNNGTWEPVTATLTVDELNSTLIFTLTGATSPTLLQLDGTPLVGFGPVPTAATVDWFAAAALPDRVQLTWQTLNEVGLSGFHLYRGPDAARPGERITAMPLPNQGVGALQGFAYVFVDPIVPVAEAPRYYWLEELHTDGSAVRHGPVQVEGALSPRLYLPLIGQ